MDWSNPVEIYTANIGVLTSDVKVFTLTKDWTVYLNKGACWFLWRELSCLAIRKDDLQCPEHSPDFPWHIGGCWHLLAQHCSKCTVVYHVWNNNFCSLTLKL